MELTRRGFFGLVAATAAGHAIRLDEPKWDGNIIVPKRQLDFKEVYREFPYGALLVDRQGRVLGKGIVTGMDVTSSVGMYEASFRGIVTEGLWAFESPPSHDAPGWPERRCVAGGAGSRRDAAGWSRDH